MFIADLEIQHGRTAIGWLHPDHPFPRGTPPASFISRLAEFTRRCGDSTSALGWPVAMGFHTCEFCGRAHASGIFGVPAGDRIYFAPEMIAHYVAHHGYSPPEEFVAALMKCPFPGTAEYSSAAAPFAHVQS